MKCPHDNADLVMTERQGIEIDYCPTCRGVWLDRGELDKIIERSTAADRAAAPRHEPPRQAAHDPHRDPRDHGYRYGEGGEGGEYGEGGDYGERGYGQGRRRKRGSLLGEIFDF
jgi:Zn-finger nucleic acid-binding protein